MGLDPGPIDVFMGGWTFGLGIAVSGYNWITRAFF